VSPPSQAVVRRGETLRSLLRRLVAIEHRWPWLLPTVSFAAGWTMILSYAIVCPWEAVASGNLLARVFPAKQIAAILEPSLDQQKLEAMPVHRFVDLLARP